MDYKRIIEKLENHEELTKEEELAAQLALVHLPIPYRTRERVIKHLKRLFRHELTKKRSESLKFDLDDLDADSCMMGVRMAQQAVRYAKYIFAAEPDKPKKVTEIADAIRRDNPDVSDEQAYRMAWETYCSYSNPSYEGCTSKGKSKRKSPKSEY